jgi:transcription-repair coupling factor (superfamily II helicase)
MDFLNNIFNYKSHDTVCGLSDELNILYYYNYFKNYNKNVLIVTNALYDSNKIYQRLKTYTDDVCLFPMDDFLPSVALAISPDLKVKRLQTLELIKSNKPHIVVTNLMGYLRYLPGIETSKKLNVNLNKGDSINRDKLIELLEEFGYKRDTLVTSTGEYAVRGFIIDIFPIEANHPIRV